VNNLPVDTPPFPLNTTFNYNSYIAHKIGLFGDFDLAFGPDISHHLAADPYTLSIDLAFNPSL
jgi:hypothetical protein